MVLGWDGRIGSCRGKVVLREMNVSKQDEGRTMTYIARKKNTELILADSNEKYSCVPC
jgi:hypothetical protein